MRRLALATALVGAALTASVAPAGAAWQPFLLPPPPGGEFATPAGLPGDLRFWAPNRGLMTVGGNNAVPEGIYSWDGVEWHQLAVVCGGGPNARIAWAGPREFWTVTRPSLPRSPIAGFALCHFKDGEIIASYSTSPRTADPFHSMVAAACDGPSNCWFGGVGAQDPSGQRIGAFHLHWNGTALRTVYNPQGRGVSDLLAHGGQILESTFVGRAYGSPADPDLREPEDPPRLLHRIVGGTFVNDPFVPAPLSGTLVDGTELRALDGTEGVAWAVGGGAFSGSASAGGPIRRPPLAARLEGGTWRELTLTGSGLTADDIFTDVAAVPGTRTAWAVVGQHNEGDGSNSQLTRVAAIGADGATNVEVLAGAGDPQRGAAVRIACPAANDCWLATGRGFLYRSTTAGAYERDTDPAFQGTIVNRPNEAAEQSIPDTPPEDDSRLHAPPIELPPPLPPAEDTECDPRPSAVWGVKRPKVHGRTKLVVSFRMRRRARVGITAYRGKRIVARAKVRMLRSGRRSLSLRVSPRRWPTRLSFVVRERLEPCESTASGDDVVSSAPPATR